MRRIVDAMAWTRGRYIVALAFLIACWWAIRGSGLFPLLPTVPEVWRALLEGLRNGQLVADALSSTGRVFTGFLIAAIFAAFMVTAAIGVRGVRQPLGALLEFLRPIPPIAWIPLAVMLVGLGNPTALFVIVVGAFFPLYTNALSAIDSIPLIFNEVAATLGASKAEIVRRVAVPGALAGVFTGVRIGMGFAWMCVVAAEMTAADSGLGYSIQLNRQALRLENVVAGMAVIGGIGWLTTSAIGVLERWLMPWRFREAGAVGKLPSLRGAAIERPHVCEDSSLPGTESSSSKKVAISLDRVAFGYLPGVDVVRDISIEVDRGEIVVLMGPSGSGKSTLLRLIAGLAKPSSGLVNVSTSCPRGGKRVVSLVFQSGAVFPWMTAEENVQFAIDQQTVAAPTGTRSAYHYLTEVGLGGLRQRYPHALSGGQNQRVALARTLASGSDLLLMDEPFSALDGPTREALQEMVLVQAKRNGITAIFVTHDVNEAVFLADRVLVLGGQPAVIKAEVGIATAARRNSEFRESDVSLRHRRELRRILEQLT